MTLNVVNIIMMTLNFLLTYARLKKYYRNLYGKFTVYPYVCSPCVLHISRYMVLRSSIKVLFSPVHRRLHALQFLPQLPVMAVIVFGSCRLPKDAVAEQV